MAYLRLDCRRWRLLPLGTAHDAAVLLKTKSYKTPAYPLLTNRRF